METILDNVSCDDWLVDLVTQTPDGLTVRLVEGLSVPNERVVAVGEIKVSANPIVRGVDSKRVVVTFSPAVLVQILDENHQKRDDYNVRDKGVVGRYSRSRLMDFARQHSDVTEIWPSPLIHFDLQTADLCFHVLSDSEPVVGIFDEGAA